jgi:very-short-patch-repair endonuclease
MPPGFHHRPVAKRNRGFAKAMRCDATTVEAAMWRLLRHRRLAGFKFHRQVPFQTYILDFVRFERKVVIEIDGSQHFESKRDQERNSVLAGEGFRVLRYWNNDVLLQPKSVLEEIFVHLADGRS